jgi:hypothetical protein
MLSFYDTLKMKKSDQYLIRTDASPKKPSPLVDILELRDLANDEITKLREALDRIRSMCTPDEKLICRVAEEALEIPVPEVNKKVLTDKSL